MNRRELLTFAIHRKSRAVELSCERLYMKFCDSLLDDTTGDLFERLEADLHSVDSLLLVDTSWLASGDLRQRLDPLMESLRARGVRIRQSSDSGQNSSRKAAG
jgi:hypothetical protein